MAQGDFGKRVAQEMKARATRITIRGRADGETDDTDAINEAITACASGGIITAQPGRSLVTAGGHVMPGSVPVWLDLAGASVSHTGDNVCFNFNPPGVFNNEAPSGLRLGTLTGNPGTSAVGVEMGNQWGPSVSGEIIGYTAGVALDLHNKTNWLEGLNVDGLKIDACAVGLRFRRTTGTFSFGYTRIRHLAINVPAGGIGIDFGADSASTVYFYNSSIEANFWPLGDGAVCVYIGSTFNSDNVDCFIVGEVPGSATGTYHYGLVNSGGSVKFRGHFNIKGASNNLSAGSTRIIPTRSGVDDQMGTRNSNVFTRLATYNIDNEHTGSFGFVDGTNVDGAFVSGYSGGPVFEVLAVPYNGDVANASSIALFHSSYITLYGGPKIIVGTGSPEGSKTANKTSLYLSTDLGGVFLKTEDSTNTGWVPIETRRAFSSPPSMVQGVSDGYGYYNTSYDRPMWWDRFRFRDAFGAEAAVFTVLGSYSFPSGSDDYRRRVVCGGATGTISLPDPTAVHPGDDYWVKMTGAGTITINSQGASKTIDGASSKSLTQWQSIRVASDGTQWLTV